LEIWPKIFFFYPNRLKAKKFSSIFNFVLQRWDRLQTTKNFVLFRVVDSGFPDSKWFMSFTYPKISTWKGVPLWQKWVLELKNFGSTFNIGNFTMTYLAVWCIMVLGFIRTWSIALSDLLPTRSPIEHERWFSISGQNPFPIAFLPTSEPENWLWTSELETNPDRTILLQVIPCIIIRTVWETQLRIHFTEISPFWWKYLDTFLFWSSYFYLNANSNHNLDD